MTDAASLKRAVEGVDTVVHLVAIRQGKQEQFERIMSQGTRDLLAASKDAGVGRFVLMSALGTSEESKDLVPYYGAKWEMEKAVEGAGIPYVIFRPSFVFERDGGILPTFAKLARFAPVTPITGSGVQRIQPIWAGDGGVLRPGDRPRGGDESDVRARRAGRRELERVLGAAEECAGSGGRASTSRWG
jgi:uncharacterized protein YbjT (DUF2867 family)